MKRHMPFLSVLLVLVLLFLGSGCRVNIEYRSCADLEGAGDSESEKEQPAWFEEDFLVLDIADQAFLLGPADGSEEPRMRLPFDRLQVFVDQAGEKAEAGDVRVGDRLRIRWDGIVLMSEPGQFGAIEQVVHVPQATEKDFLVLEVEDQAFLLAPAEDSEAGRMRLPFDRLQIFVDQAGEKAEAGDVKIGDRLQVRWDGIVLMSEPGQFGAIEQVVHVPQATEKDFLVLEVEDQAFLLAPAEDSEAGRMRLPFDRLQIFVDQAGEKAEAGDVKVGDRLRIRWDGIVLTSEPGQFGTIERIIHLPGTRE